MIAGELKIKIEKIEWNVYGATLFGARPRGRVDTRIRADQMSRAHFAHMYSFIGGLQER